MMPEPPTAKPPAAAPPEVNAPAQPFRVTELMQRLGPAGVLAVAAAALPALGGFAMLYYIDPVGTWLRSHGGTGVVLFVLGFALLAGFALVPTHSSAALGGWAFGFPVGYPAVLIGFYVAAMIGYVVARRASGDRVTTLIREHAKWQAVYDALLGQGFGRTLLIVTLLRLPPNSPFAMTNLVLAATRVPPLAYSLGTLIGMAPRTGIIVYMASTLSQLPRDGVNRTWLIVAGIVVSIIVLAVIGTIANHAITRVTNAHMRRPV